MLPTKLRGDHGAATVVAAVLALAMVGVLVLVLHVTAVLWQRHRIAGAADLAAIAAAAHAPFGHDRACAAAAGVVERMGGVLDECDVSARDARVRVHGEPAAPVGDWGLINARARAGPVRAQPIARPEGAPHVGPGGLAVAATTSGRVTTMNGRERRGGRAEW
ncbi:Rv3654c family TadE-like protein [Bounagaea algeriensis]